MQRIVCWFSCGAASAVATKLAIEENARGANHPLIVARCYIEEEHADNNRFAAECEAWFGVPVLVLRNEKYAGSIYETFTQRKFIANNKGAACTLFLKKTVRQDFQRPGDIQVFGYTAEEQHRVDRFIDANVEARIWPVLVEKGLMHSDCLAIIERTGIELPAMYKLGYHNNNCIGCVKGGMGYWNKIRSDFPAEFTRMAAFSRSLGVRLVKDGEQRIFLDALQIGTGNYPTEPEIECGIFCEMAEKEIAS